MAYKDVQRKLEMSLEDLVQEERWEDRRDRFKRRSKDAPEHKGVSGGKAQAEGPKPTSEKEVVVVEDTEEPTPSVPAGGKSKTDAEAAATQEAAAAHTAPNGKADDIARSRSPRGHAPHGAAPAHHHPPHPCMHPPHPGMHPPHHPGMPPPHHPGMPPPHPGMPYWGRPVYLPPGHPVPPHHHPHHPHHLPPPAYGGHPMHYRGPPPVGMVPHPAYMRPPPPHAYAAHRPPVPYASPPPRPAAGTAPPPEARAPPPHYASAPPHHAPPHDQQQCPPHHRPPAPNAGYGAAPDRPPSQPGPYDSPRAVASRPGPLEEPRSSPLERRPAPVDPGPDSSAGPPAHHSSKRGSKHPREGTSGVASLKPAPMGHQIRLSNIPPELTAKDIAEAFAEVSEKRLESVDLLRDASGRATGEAVIIFTSHADAQTAVSRYHGGDLNGRRLSAVHEGEVKIRR